MEFENQCSQSQSTPCFNNPNYFTPSNSQHFYSAPPNLMVVQQNPFQQVPQMNFWNQGTNLFNSQQQQQQPQQGVLFQQQPLQIPTQQFFQQPNQQDEDEQDQDYHPESEEESSSDEEQGQEDLQEEEQFDDPDFDLQAYLKVRDQL